MCQAIQEMIEEGRNEGSKMKAYKTAENLFTKGFSAEETALLVEENPGDNCRVV